MKKWELKQYGLSVRINDGGGVSGRLVELIARAKVCMNHSMQYILGENYYRKYKRGKNRCLGCGVKLVLS